MIAGRLDLFLQRVRDRGYTLEEVSACVVRQDGGIVTVDETHPSYPLHPKQSSTQATGAGSYLSAFFSRFFGQKADPNCSCRAVAAQMDRMGPQWCRDNMGWILEHVQANAKKRGLPFIKPVVEKIVLLAIRKAEQNAMGGE